VAGEITAAAFDLFARQGFEATTVDEIATSAGLSRRSFFRYFPTKEEVLLQSLDATGDALRAGLAARPAAEAPWTALRRTFDTLVTAVDADPDRSAVLLDMLMSSPALHAAHLAKQAAWQRLLTDALLGRGGPPDDAGDPPGRRDRPADLARLEASCLAGAALACLEAAQVLWIDHRRRPDPSRDALGALLDQAMRSVQPLRS